MFFRNKRLIRFSRFYTTVEPECKLEHLDGKYLGTSVMTFFRPKSRNALGRQLVTEMQNSLEKVRENKSRVLIIKSDVDGVFCSGADLKERATMSQIEGEAFVNKLRRLFSDVESLPLPTIACVSGFALGGGLELALACDLRVAEKETAVMGLSETSLAIIPGAGGTQRLPRIVGVSRAKELIYTAKKLNAEQAEKIGLVNYAVAKGQGYAKCLEIALEILPNIAIKVAKVAIQEGIELSRESGMILEQQCYAQVLVTKDRIEGLTAFKEKRAPQYKGE